MTLTSESFTSKEILARDLYECVKEKQDDWLKNHRSRTGAISIKTAKDIVNWATNPPLNLLFPSTLTLRPEARLLDNLISDEEYDAFHGVSPRNPMQISLSERLFYLHKLLMGDGIALVHIMNGLRSISTWSRKEVASSLQRAYEMYGNKLKQLAQSSSEIAKANDILRLADLMKKARPGVVGTKELRVTPRLENLVDLHIIGKPNDKKRSFIYCRNESSDRFVEKFNNVEEPAQHINRNFFERCSYIYRIDAKRSNEDEIFWALIGNFKAMTAAYGLAGIDEVCLLTAIKALAGEEARIVEITNAKAVLLEKQKEYQGDIKLHVDTKGRIRYFSVSNGFLSKFAN